MKNGTASRYARTFSISPLPVVGRLHQRIPLCVLPEDLFQFFHYRLLSFRLAALRR